VASPEAQALHAEDVQHLSIHQHLASEYHSQHQQSPSYYALEMLHLGALGTKPMAPKQIVDLPG
jgi:hypothetical protein